MPVRVRLNKYKQLKITKNVLLGTVNQRVIRSSRIGGAENQLIIKVAIGDFILQTICKHQDQFERTDTNL